MRSVLLVLALVLPAGAGTINGVVLEHQSGRPLARTIVRLDQVPEAGGGTTQPPVTTRTQRSGQFLFARIPPGLYIVTAVRTGYFPASYGQRLPAGRGTPIRVTADSSFFAELRARLKGAITGRVLDENGVGTSGVPVVAYRARLPLRSETSGTSDDRGVYRIHGLEPGKYWVRSAGHVLEDGTGWLPTFGPVSREVRDAKIHQVMVDGETAYADVSPEAGALFTLEGTISCPNPVEIEVSVSSETGRQRARTKCGPEPGTFQFRALPPGPYEIFAATADGKESAFLDLNLQRNLPVNLALSPSPTVQVEFVKGNTSFDVPGMKLLARRQDLSESTPPVEVPRGRVALPPGYWEFTATLPSGYYIENIGNMRGVVRRPGRTSPADAFEVYIDQHLWTRLRVSISDQGGEITGRVVTGDKPVPGAPVFLWPAEEGPRRSLGGSRQLLSDTEGSFRFNGLPSGTYHVLATFDASEADADLIEASRAPAVKVEASRPATVELTPWVAPW